ncbi:MAG: hypothetical protein Q7R83_04495 [bacterium]|nr:hypothetical protein [bacterium]
MKFLLFRLLPFLAAVLGAVAALFQWRDPQLYPWPFVWFGLFYVFAIVLLTRGRLPWLEAVSKSVPSVLALTAAALSMLVVEGDWAHWFFVGLFALVPYIVLELLFLLAWAPVRYPVNSVSRLNIAFFILSCCFIAFAFDGLQIFLRFPSWVVLLLMALWTAGGYVLTSHPTATRKSKERWGVIGACVGLQAGLLVVALPNSMLVLGTTCALLVGIPLRARRYSFHPLPALRTAWIEGGLCLVLFTGVLFVARWT